MDISVATADRSDAKTLLAIQRAAFQLEAERYGDSQIPPLVQTLAELEKELDASLCLKALADAVLIGAVRLRADGTDAEISRLVVRPDWQSHGVGRLLMERIEQAAPSTVTNFTLFTGHLSVRNLDFYKGLGYQEYERRRLTDAITLVYLNKRRC